MTYTPAAMSPAAVRSLANRQKAKARQSQRAADRLTRDLLAGRRAGRTVARRILTFRDAARDAGAAAAVILSRLDDALTLAAGRATSF